ncbi:MAG: HIT domain-containing protein [Syntrophorhabdaceae bacterium]|nr:HIT domain-containing protein [Syntrophorhabdaceae bacterium]
MERVFSPWRGEYIRRSSGGAEEKSGCVFCVDEGDMAVPDRLLLGIYPSTAALLNRYPYNSGHLLIVPRRHVADLTDLSSEELRELFSLVVLGTRALREIYGPAGLNVGMNLGKAAGAGIAGHLHVHLVPRWSGDTNFMTSVHDARVLPESLLETRERLLPAFADLKP